MRGGNCRGGAASGTATGRTSSVGGGGAEATASGAVSATGCAPTTTGSLVPIAAATTEAGGVTGRAFRLGGTRLTMGAGGGGISVIVAESAGNGSKPTEGRIGHIVTIKCARSDATTAAASVPPGCCRSQSNGQTPGIEVMRRNVGIGRVGCVSRASRQWRQLGNQRFDGGGLVLNAHPLALDDEAIVAEPADRGYQHAVLRREDARGQGCLVVVVPHCDRALGDDGSVVDLRSHEMSRAAVHLDAIGECAAVRIEARIRRQERGVNVEQAIAIARDDVWSQDAHESREHDEIGSKRVDCEAKCLIEGFPVGERKMVDNRRWYAVTGGDGKTGGVGPIADYADDATGNPPRAFGVEDCRHV